MGKDLGDFQTPPELAAALVRRLGPIGGRWPRVLEPTSGRGGFLRAILDSPSPPREAIGVELQSAYCDEARAGLGDRATILHADVFQLDLGVDLPWKGDGPILVVGNPPWVTNAELGRLESGNLPPKRNLKKLGGLAARTGAANFDLGEAVWLKLIADLDGRAATIAMLCKTSVARAILQHLAKVRTAFTADMVEIDARRWFGAAVGACFLTIALGTTAGTGRVDVYSNPDATTPTRSMGAIRGLFADDFETALAFEFALGASPLHWRQGVKHDAAAVMELIADGPGEPLCNGLGEVVDVEPEYVYPLLKGADLRKPAGDRPRRALIVCQEKLGDDTRTLATTAPRLWAYLDGHRDRFERRRSSIYEGRPPFALFGVGPYTFAPYKAVVAGVHRPPRFRAVGPVAGRPTVLDDTCYLIPCRSAAEAALIAAIGDDPITLGLLRAFAPADAKRPVTKGLLQAIDLAVVLARADRRALVARAVVALRDDLGVADADPTAAIETAVEPLALLLSGERVPTLGPDATSPESRPRAAEES
ncbi:class I SAM-dependent methyltransferase [Paludisphaera mucosa]|uniref:Class I SAM-dependent methyltransferase n=1 Tax=Paludisphaera mucosa TaxID=3030827 RepID=A0ABT6FGT0_9BACT|nr:class I SAM-dependent methyltransferase [Paludisphaera mucosa]MDG3006724.1 class I SAM-dependent methyltransferase [Paludisphaera mucosa]